LSVWEESQQSPDPRFFTPNFGFFLVSLFFEDFFPRNQYLVDKRVVLSIVEW
jgi:hypothetical protein